MYLLVKSPCSEDSLVVAAVAIEQEIDIQMKALIGHASAECVIIGSGWGFDWYYRIFALWSSKSGIPLLLGSEA